jgi:hypothetical protein
MTVPGFRLPAAVRQFLTRAVDNAQQLEIVMLLRRDAEHYANAAAIGDRTGLTSAAAADALEALAGRGILDVRLTDTIKYRYSPATDEQRRAFDSIAELWRTDRHVLIDTLAAKRHVLKDFSDAFRIGKDKHRA